MNPDDSFASHVAAVREVCLDAFGHQNVGIDEVVREVNPSRSTGHDGMDELVRLGFSMRKDASGYRLEGVDVTQLEAVRCRRAFGSARPVSRSVDAAFRRHFGRSSGRGCPGDARSAGRGIR
ncbi:putative non-ribosomal peptide synthetase MbtE [Mycobacteroides abscessus subsp. abscessus]|nr:putative non-ribosomal peptide synthetase MbtE [Mycobacteroides abscessus subsp. abscessus]